ncbi:hypothetical protein CPB84DRAFT_1765440 [Gymnopilus junonius]|uniref:Uncharacterized protein n=1 Tax=Gymnopilus junonius TaxID=109634 RepID=A0A9P5NYM4_GYMJU|nr:hypothetical protein CPB84DRAFT_1765440 [Gymnopilus junonius]
MDQLAVSHIAHSQSPGGRPRGSAVTLRKPERGFIYAGAGMPTASIMQAGSPTVIFASEVATVPHWPDVQVTPQAEYRYRVMVTLSEKYADIRANGAPVSPKRKGGLIHHSALSRRRDGPALSTTDWAPGNTAYLLKTHTYTGNEGATETIVQGECVYIRSYPRSLKSANLTSNPSMAYYSFQRTTETVAKKVWLSAEKIHEAYLV